MEFAVYTIGDEIQVSIYEDGHKFSDFRLTIDEAESMVRKLNQAKSDLMFKMCNSVNLIKKTTIMKAYTDIEQSKRLAEILPIKSADMRYAPYGDTHPWFWDGNLLEIEAIPCWSLAALLSVLPVSYDDGQHCFALINSNPNGDTEWLCCYEDCKGNLLNECYADNPIDACYEMILKLNEQKLL